MGSPTEFVSKFGSKEQIQPSFASWGDCVHVLPDIGIDYYML